LRRSLAQAPPDRAGHGLLRRHLRIAAELGLVRLGVRVDQDLHLTAGLLRTAERVERLRDVGQYGAGQGGLAHLDVTLSGDAEELRLELAVPGGALEVQRCPADGGHELAHHVGLHGHEDRLDLIGPLLVRLHPRLSIAGGALGHGHLGGLDGVLVPSPRVVAFAGLRKIGHDASFCDSWSRVTWTDSVYRHTKAPSCLRGPSERRWMPGPGTTSSVSPRRRLGSVERHGQVAGAHGVRVLDAEVRGVADQRHRAGLSVALADVGLRRMDAEHRGLGLDDRNGALTEDRGLLEPPADRLAVRSALGLNAADADEVAPGRSEKHEAPVLTAPHRA